MAIEYPYSNQSERSTLGAMLVSADAQRIGLSSLLPEDFYVPANRLVFDCMKRMEERHQAIDITTLTADLNSIGKLDEVGGVVGLVSMADEVVIENIDYYISTLKEKTNLRDLLTLINKIVEDVSHKSITDSDAYLDDVEQKVIQIVRNRKTGDFVSTSDILTQIKQKYYAGASSKTKTTGVPSGYSDLDRRTNGFQKGDMIILAARTSMGKTQLAINFALNAARETGAPIGFFSVEMPAEQIVNRMISTCARIRSENLRSFRLSRDDLIKFEEGINKLSKYNIYFDETSSRLLDIQTKARKLKNEHPDLALIVVDYLQLIEATGQHENRTQEVGSVSRGIKALARELNVPIVCLAQLSRQLESRGKGDKRPMLSDLRESGAIEQDADMVLFIYRKDYYEHDEGPKPEAVDTELIIAKQRNGVTDTIHLVFVKSTGEFSAAAPGSGQGS